MSEQGQTASALDALDEVKAMLRSIGGGFGASEQTELSSAMASSADSCIPRLEAVAEALTASLSREAALVEALEKALPRLAHEVSCYSPRPTSEWAEHGSVSFANCDCVIRTVRAALAQSQERTSEGAK